tara:strand:- start:225 stop:476 length:252 start_codon:yes stop_codon:yes gene_type:complete
MVLLVGEDSESQDFVADVPNILLIVFSTNTEKDEQPSLDLPGRLTTGLYGRAQHALNYSAHDLAGFPETNSVGCGQAIGEQLN